MDVTEQGRRKVKSARWHFHLRLPAGCAVGYALIHQPLNSIKLNPIDDRANVDGFVERRPNAERAHAVAYLRDQRLGDAFLHEQARAGATHLSLIKPDSID